MFRIVSVGNGSPVGYLRVLKHVLVPLGLGALHSLSRSGTNQIGIKIVRPDFPPITPNLIWRYLMNHSLRPSFRLGRLSCEISTRIIVRSLSLIIRYKGLFKGKLVAGGPNDFVHGA